MGCCMGVVRVRVGRWGYSVLRAAWGQPPVQSMVEICMEGLPVVAS